MKLIQKNIFWVFLLTASRLLGQIDNDIPGTYIMTEKIGIHVEPGLSIGNDIHATSYISSVDTTVTNTIILDSLYSVSFISDTTFGPGTSRRIGDPIIKMIGTWSVVEDTLVVQYMSVDTTYNYVSIKDTITTYVDGVEYKILPDKETPPTPLSTLIRKKFRIMYWEKGIYTIIPLGEKRRWIEYSKQ